MNRRDFLRTAVLGAAACTLHSTPRASAATPGKPNFLFIFADDQTFEAIHALGCDEIHTPNLDRLVRNGVTFTHAFNQGAWHGAVCVASRTMLNTGLFLWHAKKAEPTLKEGGYTGGLWSEYLGQAGYDTYMTGKWHVKTDVRKAFKDTGQIRGGMPNDSPEGYNRPIEGRPDVWRPWDTQFGGYWKGGKHWSEVVADDAGAFLGHASKTDTPFFMYVAFNAPHDPRQSPKAYVDRYPLDKVAVPKNFLPEYPNKAAIGCGKDLRDERLAPFPRTEYAVKVNRQEYYAIITHMDAQVGRILDALERSGKANETYVFFTADHGLAVGHHGLLGKQNLYDHSVRVPLMVCGPGIDADRRIAAPVYLQDIMPSTLELAGIDTPPHVQFKSLMPLIEGRADRNYDAIYGAYMNYQRMVTKGDYKLIYYPKLRKTLLFNLRKDPLEMHNLAEKKRHAARVQELKQVLRSLQAETGDTLVIR